MKTITKHYIDGAFVESHGHEVMDIINPTSGKVIAKVTLADEQDARRVIAAARRAFTTYGRSKVDERAKTLRRLHEVFSARVDDLTDAMVEESGGVVQFAAPIAEAGVNAFLAAEKALEVLPLTRSSGETTVTLQPVGVVGLMTPWNASALFLCLKLSLAVAAGCTVVIKPSELSAMQTQVWLECVQEAKLPNGLCNVVSGRGDVVGAELIRNPDVPWISLTGSVAAGKSIMRDRALTMKRVTLELGGKLPNILLDDADLKKAIPNALVIGFLNSGRACPAATRLLVPKSRLDEVKQAILNAMPAFPAGPVGPMMTDNQYDQVQSFIRKGIEEGAEVLAGGEGHPEGLEAGYFVKPTVFVNVQNTMTIAREEIYGPVLCVIAYENEEDAIRIANDTNCSHHAYVSGTDLQRARRLASQLPSGRVAINGMVDDHQASFGGFKNSSGAESGIEAFFTPSAIIE